MLAEPGTSWDHTPCVIGHAEHEDAPDRTDLGVVDLRQWLPLLPEGKGSRVQIGRPDWGFCRFRPRSSGRSLAVADGDGRDHGPDVDR